MNIFLVGYRCTGKTTIGKSLAEKLDWPFTDSDHEIEKEYKTSISEMVKKDGWDKFRNRERKIIKELSFLNKTVIATGGGIVLSMANISEIRKSGIVVWLRAEKDTILKRMASDENTESQRPSLLGTDLDTEVKETLGKRTPLYEKSCDFWIDTDNTEKFLITEMILEKIKKRGLKI